MLLYQAVLYPADDDGIWGCAVPDLLINASGRDRAWAIEDAVAIMSEVLADMSARGEPFPEPSVDIDLDGGTLVILPAKLAEPA
ncbi:MAG: hypothetical protein AAF676_12120 [Pseudomonadota bacterium]